MKKTLLRIVFAGGLALGAIALGGCNKDHSEYNYNGKVEKDKVRFYEEGFVNYLEVTKPNGKVITYVDDHGEDLRIDEVRFRVGDHETMYDDPTKYGNEVLKGGQRRFDTYLEKIGKINSREKAVKETKEHEYMEKSVKDLFSGEDSGGIEKKVNEIFDDLEGEGPGIETSKK